MERPTQLDREAAALGVPKPKIEHYTYTEGEVVVHALTPESEAAWGDYLRKVTLAKIALNSKPL